MGVFEGNHRYVTTGRSDDSCRWRYVGYLRLESIASAQFLFFWVNCS